MCDNQLDETVYELNSRLSTRFPAEEGRKRGGDPEDANKHHTLTAVPMRLLRCSASETWQTTPTAAIPFAVSASTASSTFLCQPPHT